MALERSLSSALKPFLYFPFASSLGEQLMLWVGDEITGGCRVLEARGGRMLFLSQQD